MSEARTIPPWFCYWGNSTGTVYVGWYRRLRMLQHFELLDRDND